MNDSQKIEELLHHFRMKAKEFAEKCGFDSETISGIKRGKHKISLKVATKILNAFPEVNKVWLTTGEGEMLNTINQSIIGGNSNSIIQQNVSGGNHNSLNLHNIDDLEKIIELKDQLLAEKDERLREKDERLREKDERLREKDERIQELKQIINELKSK